MAAAEERIYAIVLIIIVFVAVRFIIKKQFKALAHGGCMPWKSQSEKSHWHAAKSSFRQIYYSILNNHFAF